jgi:hypothetical protein
VESFHQARAEVPETEKKKTRLQAKRYFRLALRYAVCGSKPTVLIVMGRIASGKSTLARALGRELDCEVISSDRVRKEFASVPLYQRDEKSASRLYSRGNDQRDLCNSFPGRRKSARSRCGRYSGCYFWPEAAQGRAQQVAGLKGRNLPIHRGAGG